jgi:hypothetical protein
VGLSENQARADRSRFRIGGADPGQLRLGFVLDVCIIEGPFFANGIYFQGMIVDDMECSHAK